MNAATGLATPIIRHTLLHTHTHTSAIYFFNFIDALSKKGICCFKDSSDYSHVTMSQNHGIFGCRIIGMLVTINDGNRL